MLWDEHNLVVERVNGLVITQANLLLLAISANLGKDGKTSFDKQIRKLNVEVIPFED